MPPAAYVDGQSLRDSPVFAFATIAFMILATLAVAWLALQPRTPWAWAWLVLLPIAAILFMATLQVRVRVDPESVELRLDPVRRMRVPLPEIQQVTVLAGPRQHIRPPPGAVLFQVRTASGVVLDLRDGRRIWVACNYPQLLANAIEVLRDRVIAS